MTTIEITEEDDVVLRRYAKKLGDNGEDAYHNAVCTILEGTAKEIKDIRGLCIVATKRSLFKIFRHESAERRNIEHYINGDPVPIQVGLQYGRQKLTKCRKGLHEMIEENLTYVGTRRTCLACMQDRLKRKTRR